MNITDPSEAEMLALENMDKALSYAAISGREAVAPCLTWQTFEWVRQTLERMSEEHHDHATRVTAILMH
jgi:hypothetical protein